MMKIDYKKELEAASRVMIMIHDPKLLIKLIIRLIVRKLNVRHAAMILYEPQKDAYVLSISRGQPGLRIPTGYTRFELNNPLIKLFIDDEYRSLTVNRNAIVTEDITKMVWQESVVTNGNGTKALLHEVDRQMHMLSTVACVPAYYQDRLLAILLLGEKQDGDKYDEEELNFFAALASDAAMAIRNAQLFRDLEREAQRNRELFIKTVIALGSTIEAKDAYTHGHTERVTNYALAIARQMKEDKLADFDKKFFENLYIGGLLHDIGKIAVPENILNKPGSLTPEEHVIMKQHTLKGAEIVRPLELPKESVDAILYHHERYDGKGYPEGLKGDKIPISAAVLAVADCLDAMITDRPYRKGLPKEVALQEIKKNNGVQFHPLAVQSLVSLYEAGKV